MPVHLAGFDEVQDPAGAFVFVAALDDVLGLDDGDDFIIPTLSRVGLMAVGVPSGANQRARITAPSLRDLSTWELSNFNGGADADAEPDSPQKVHDFRSSPFPLQEDERVNCEMDYNPTTTEAGWVLFWLTDAPIVSGVPGRMFTVRVTATVTMVVTTWTNASIAFTDALKAGRYAIVGARWQSAGLVATRFVFRDTVWRPGVLGVDDENDEQAPMFRYGGMGVLGEFEFNTPPSVDFLSISADTAPTGVLDLVVVREGRS